MKRFHAWRKGTKDLLFQSAFLKNLNSKFFSCRIEGFEKLARLLGNTHDLAVLETAGAKLRLGNEPLKLVHVRKFQLQNAAFALAGKKMFAGTSFFPGTD